MAAFPHAAAPSAVLADMKSVAECDATLDALTVFIAQAERRLSAISRRSSNEPPDWRPALTAELRIAKLTLPRMQERRADLKREERRTASQAAQLARADLKRRHMIRLAWETEREAMSRVEALAHQRYPDLFTGEEARS